MERIKPKIIILLISTVCLLCLCACSPLGNRLDTLTSEESQLIEKKSNEIIRCLTENDKDAFRSLFCDQVRKSDMFDQQVDDVFDYFTCEVYIKSEVVNTAGGESSSENGERTEWYVTPEITYIEVLQKADEEDEEMPDRYYGVRYDWQIKDSEHPEHEGLTHFEITLLNTDDSVEIGFDE